MKYILFKIISVFKVKQQIQVYIKAPSFFHAYILKMDMHLWSKYVLDTFLMTNPCYYDHL